MADFLMQSRDNPMKALGLAFSIITVMVLVTVMISTIIYFRNTKSNRITPARRIIRRRPKEPRRWTFRPRFGRRDQSFGKFFPDDDTSDSPRAKPPTPALRRSRLRLRFTPGRASGCGQCPRCPALASRNTSRRTSKSTDASRDLAKTKTAVASALL